LLSQLSETHRQYQREQVRLNEVKLFQSTAQFHVQTGLDVKQCRQPERSLQHVETPSRPSIIIPFEVRTDLLQVVQDKEYTVSKKSQCVHKLSSLDNLESRLT
jgi:hypothetical protein